MLVRPTVIRARLLRCRMRLARPATTSWPVVLMTTPKMTIVILAIMKASCLSKIRTFTANTLLKPPAWTTVGSAASSPAAAPSKTPKCGTTPMTTMNHSVRSPMPNKRRVLITDCLHNRDDFFHALETVRCEHTAPAPKNLDGLADFLVDARIDRITCANWDLNDADATAIAQVLDDLGVKLYR